MSEHHRSFFASSIAAALSHFCQVDSADVKAKLMGKSKIKLKDVLLIPKVIRSNEGYDIEVTGRVDVAEFQYKMNVIKGSKSVRKARLDVNSVHIYLDVKAKSSHGFTELSHSLDRSVGNTNQPTNWKQKFVKNIIDQIGIHVQDLTVSLNMPQDHDSDDGRETSIVVHANDTELIAFKRDKLKTKSMWKRKKDKNAPLIQRLEIGSLSSSVTERDDNGIIQSIPFVKPFRYSCSLKRFHGERFDGMQWGLEVIGDIKVPTVPLPLVQCISDDGQSDDDETEKLFFSSVEDLAVSAQDDEFEIHFLQMDDPVYIRTFVDSENEASTTPCHVKIHLGELQSHALCRAISYFRGQPNHQSSNPEVNRRHIVPSSMKITSKQRKSSISLTSSNSSEKDAFRSSIYCLPFPSLEVQFPNNSDIYLSRCEWQYRTDGSVHKIEGNGGAVINNVGILDDQGKWYVDFSKRYIVIRPSRQRESNKFLQKDFSIHDHGADLTLNLLELRSFVEGLQSVMGLCKNEMIQLGTKTNQKAWELHIEGNTKLKL